MFPDLPCWTHHTGGKKCSSYKTQWSRSLSGSQPKNMCISGNACLALPGSQLMYSELVRFPVAVNPMIVPNHVGLTWHMMSAHSGLRIHDTSRQHCQPRHPTSMQTNKINGTLFWDLRHGTYGMAWHGSDRIGSERIGTERDERTRVEGWEEGRERGREMSISARIRIWSFPEASLPPPEGELVLDILMLRSSFLGSTTCGSDRSPMAEEDRGVGRLRPSCCAGLRMLLVFWAHCSSGELVGDAGFDGRVPKVDGGELRCIFPEDVTALLVGAKMSLNTSGMRSLIAR